MKIKQHIEIVSSEISGLNSLNKVSRSAIYTVLARHYTNVSITIINNIADLEMLAARQPDLVFLGMKFIPLHSGDLRSPDRIWISDYLELQGITHTGSNAAAHLLEHNKHLSKQRMLDECIMTAPFFVSTQDQPILQAASLSFPLFVKPNDRGGGLGIDNNSVVHDLDSLNLKIRTISSVVGSDSLVEEYLPGREFSVAILKDEFSDEFSIMPIELIAPADSRGFSMLSSKIKSSNSEQVLEVTDQAIRAKICALALAAFQALGARDYGRIDIRLDTSGVPHFLEANLLPSLIGGYGSFPKACVLNNSLEYEPMIVRITKLGLARKKHNIQDIPQPLTTMVPVFPSTEIAFELA